MDFHSLPRRDLQFLCKRNKIPANKTNVAMADALKSLEIVEGLDEYMNESDANAPHSPTTVANQPPKTATRTTRRKTTTKAEPQPSSKLVTSSCHLKSKSLAGEMDQESKINKVAKTPAATSCIIKVQESKKDESLQSLYSTRRSTRLLGKVMADLSLETKETLEKPEKKEDTEQKASQQENSPAGGSEELNEEEDEFIPGRDLSATMEKEWKMSKNDSDEEVYVDIGDIAVLDANTEQENSPAAGSEEGDEVNADLSLEIKKTLEILEKNEDTEQKESEQENTPVAGSEEMNEVISGSYLSASMEKECEMSKNDSDVAVLDADTETNLETPVAVVGVEKESMNILGQEDKQEDQAMSEEDREKNEPNNVPLALEQQEAEEGIQEKDFESEKINTFGEEDTVVDQPGCDVGDSATEPEKINVDLGDIPVFDSANTETNNDQKALEQVEQRETEEAIQENELEPEAEKFDEDTTMDQTGTDACHSETDLEKTNTFDLMVDQAGIDAGDSEDNSGVDEDGTVSEAETNNDQKEPKNVLALEQVEQKETEEAVQENDLVEPEAEKNNTFDEDTTGSDQDAMVGQTGIGAGDSEDSSGVDADDTISEADSNQAVAGSDIADEEMMIVSESEGSLPLHAEESQVKASPFASESISVQFPRPNKSATPSKNSALKLFNVENKDKENNMEMMNVVDKREEGKKKKKKVAIDEERLKEVSLRQLVKMVKKLSIKSGNRTALQILPDDNQMA